MRTGCRSQCRPMGTLSATFGQHCQIVRKKMTTIGLSFCYAENREAFFTALNSIFSHSHTMKKKSASQSAFLNLRLLTGRVLSPGRRLSGAAGLWPVLRRKRSRKITLPRMSTTPLSLPGLTVPSFERLASTCKKTCGLEPS